jgi:hypothetical protein
MSEPSADHPQAIVTVIQSTHTPRTSSVSILYCLLHEQETLGVYVHTACISLFKVCLFLCSYSLECTIS